MAEFSMDQHGSRFLQVELGTATAEVLKMVYDGVVPRHAIALMTDRFGNYVSQSLVCL